MKNFKYLLILIFLFSCGYDPIYQTDQKVNFKIDAIKYSGDKKINQLIVKKIEKFKKNNAKNIFDLDLESFKNENIITKDKKGNAASYKLILEVNITLINTNNLSWIITNCGHTASCRKCFTDSVISKNYFKNKSNEIIEKELQKFYNCVFSIEL